VSRGSRQIGAARRARRLWRPGGPVRQRPPAARLPSISSRLLLAVRRKAPSRTWSLLRESRRQKRTLGTFKELPQRLRDLAAPGRERHVPRVSSCARTNSFLEGMAARSRTAWRFPVTGFREGTSPNSPMVQGGCDRPFDGRRVESGPARAAGVEILVTFVPVIRLPRRRESP